MFNRFSDFQQDVCNLLFVNVGQSIATPSGKQLALLFFSESGRTANNCSCAMCGKQVTQTSAYFILCAHIRTHQESDISIRLSDSLNLPRAAFAELSYPQKTPASHSWMECVTLALQPFSFAENIVFRMHLKWDSISKNTLLSYLQKMTTHAGKNIKNTLTERFSVFLDGWTTSNTHYVGLSATFTTESSDVFYKVFPANSPIERETSHNSKEHLYFLVFLLSLYDRTVNNLVTLIGDNCSTKQAFSRIVGGHVLFCHIHCYNFAANKNIEKKKELVEKIESLMKNLSYSIPCAILDWINPISSKQSNSTLWKLSAATLR